MRREIFPKYTSEHKLYIDTVMGLFYLFLASVLIVLGIMGIASYYIKGMDYSIFVFILGIVIMGLALLIIRPRI